MAEPVLDIAECKRTAGCCEIEDKNQHHRFLRLKADDLLGIDRRQRNRHSNAALVKNRTGQQPHEVLVLPGLTKSLGQPRQ